MNRCRWATVLILLLPAVSPGCTRPPAAFPPSPPRDAGRVGATATVTSASGGEIDFVERAADLGIAATYRNGGESDHCTMLESLGGGVGWFDFDRDGWLDLVATGRLQRTGNARAHPEVLVRRVRDRVDGEGLDVDVTDCELGRVGVHPGDRTTLTPPLSALRGS